MTCVRVARWKFRIFAAAAAAAAAASSPAAPGFLLVFSLPGSQWHRSNNFLKEHCARLHLLAFTSVPMARALMARAAREIKAWSAPASILLFAFENTCLPLSNRASGVRVLWLIRLFPPHLSSQYCSHQMPLRRCGRLSRILNWAAKAAAPSNALRRLRTCHRRICASVARYLLSSEVG